MKNELEKLQNEIIEYAHENREEIAKLRRRDERRGHLFFEVIGMSKKLGENRPSADVLSDMAFKALVAAALY